MHCSAPELQRYIALFPLRTTFNRCQSLIDSLSALNTSTSRSARHHDYSTLALIEQQPYTYVEQDC